MVRLTYPVPDPTCPDRRVLVLPEAEHRPAGAQLFEDHLQRPISCGDHGRSAHDRNKPPADLLFSARRRRSLYAP